MSPRVPSFLLLSNLDPKASAASSITFIFFCFAKDSISLKFPERPLICTKIIALVFLLIFFLSHLNQ